MLQERLSSGTQSSAHRAKSNLRRRVREKKVVSKNHEEEQKGQNGTIPQADAADLVLTKENNTSAKPQEEVAACITPRPPDHGERGRSRLCRPQSAPSRSGRISKTFSEKISRDVQHPKHKTNPTNEGAAVKPAEVTVNVKRRRPLRAKTASAATFRNLYGHSSATSTFRWKEEEMASPRPQIPLTGQSLLQTSRMKHDPPQSDLKTVAVPSEGETIHFPQAIKAEDVAICRIQGALRGWMTRSRLREEWNLGPQDRLKVSRY
jgi:hypothetical protein